MKLHVQIDRAEALRRGYPTNSDSIALEVAAAEIEALPSEDRELLAARLQYDGAVASRATYDGRLETRSCLRISEPTLAGILERIREEDAATTARAAERAQEHAIWEERYRRECLKVLHEQNWSDYHDAPNWTASGGVGSVRAEEIRQGCIAEVPGASHWIASERERVAREKAARQAAIAWEVAEAAAAKQAALDERRRWIEEHGSERLRRAAAEGIEHGAIYRDERLALERPGWYWLDGIPGTTDDPRNPPAEAFRMLDEARKIDETAKLAYYTIAHQHTHECEMFDVDGEACPQYDLIGYVAKVEFLGRTIIFGAPTD